MLRRLSLALVSLMLVSGAGTAATGVRVEGRIVDPSGLALPGVTVRLVSPASASPQSTVTALDGLYCFDAEPGAYRLEAELDGFQPTARDVAVQAALVLPDITMALAHFSTGTTVVASLPSEVQPRSFGVPATIAASVIESAPLRGGRYDDVLPLVPNVVRGPDGLVSVAGARAPQGVVLVNGVEASDIASGDPAAPLPLGAVESVQVITTGYPVEFGASTGGVTIVNSRAGGDLFKFSINSFTPRPRLTDDGVHGIEAWEPQMSLRGPIVKGSAWFAQSLDYHYEKTLARTVAGEQDRRQHSVASFTQVDARAPGGHVITAWVSGQSEHTDGEHLSAFTPLGTVPNLERREWSAVAIDRVARGASALDTRIVVRQQHVSLIPVGAGPSIVGHEVSQGAYFESVDRRANAVQAESVFSRPLSGSWGRHLVKAGASMSRRAVSGTERGTPVTYLRSTRVPAMTIDFVGAGDYHGSSMLFGGFVQDAWDVSDHLRLDLGVRLDRSDTTGWLSTPRAGLTWNVGERTTLSGGAGWFGGDLPAAALAFAGFQSRRVSAFDAAGVAAAPPTTYRNVVASDLSWMRARIWNVRLDYRLAPGWQLRVAAQERRGSHEPVVSAAVGADGATAVLSTSGTSRARSLETTLGYRPSGTGHQFYVSYVRSATSGNTNDFGLVDGLFRSPRLDSAETAPLPADTPNRLLVWGVFSLPWQITVAPFFDLRSGFPFSPVGDDWSYAGPRFSQRFPTFASLDVVVNKIVRLPGGGRARVGFKVYNIAGRGNGREIQADVARPDFGRTYNGLGRQVRGVFEIIWSGSS